MTLYRYTFDGEGIYEALRKRTGAGFSYIPNLNWLPSPNVYLKMPGLDLESWFTEMGNMLFIQRTLPTIKKFLGDIDVEARKGIPGTPVYVDPYQVVIDKGSCDWCEGGACDLLIGKGIQCEIDGDDGIMRVYVDGEEAGQRKVNFCPMCGREVGGLVNTAFEEAKKIDYFREYLERGRD